MEKTRLGKTDLMVTRSAFGALPIQRLPTQEAATLLRSAFDRGINFFDTARSYSDSEEKMGLALSDVRDQIIIATKTPSTDPEGFWKDLETSLTYLRTDYIDIYQFHNIAEIPTIDSPLYRCMIQAKELGKIRHIGVTCHLLTNARIAMQSGLYDTIQFPLSALSSTEEIAFAKECAQYDIGVIAMKALCGGLLTSAAPSMAYLRSMSHVVPIYGIQRDSELQEIVDLEKNPPALDEAMLSRIAKDRLELAGDFCRGCGYCMPCSVDIRINWCARMPLLLRRAPYETFLQPDWQEQMAKIEQCTQCGLCQSRCPYQLEIPRILKSALQDYKSFANQHGSLSRSFFSNFITS